MPVKQKHGGRKTRADIRLECSGSTAQGRRGGACGYFWSVSDNSPHIFYPTGLVPCGDEGIQTLRVMVSYVDAN